MGERREYGGLDWFRVIAAALVVAIHTSPLLGIGEAADFFLTRVLARVAVPFFLMVTGQFVVARLWRSEEGARRYLMKYVRKMLLLYVVFIILYLPVGIYAGNYKGFTLLDWIRNLLFDGTFYHLWYFPACIMGVFIVYGLRKILSARQVLAVSIVLYVFGLLGDSYYGVVEAVPILKTIYEGIFAVSSHTRNGVFMAPIFLTLGAMLGTNFALPARRRSKTREAEMRLLLWGMLATMFLLMTAEAFLLRQFKMQRHDSMYLFLIPVMICLYQVLMQWDVKAKPEVRDFALWVYALHPGVIVAVRGMAKVLKLTKLLVENNLVHYLAVLVLSFAAAALISVILPAVRAFAEGFLERGEEEREEVRGSRERKQGGEEDRGRWERKRGRRREMGMSTAERQNEPCDRAWIELDREALEQNVKFLRSRLPKQCRLMPAIKADAYGHGAVLLGRELNKLGVDAFCVACIDEGIELRQAQIKGEILILGYTHPSRFAMLGKYHLTQTVVDYDYARKLNRFGKPLHVHVAVDTGMHRLGERSENIERICSIYGMKNLIIDGIFSHLCVADVVGAQEQIYTRWQAEGFEHVLKELKKRGCRCRGVHLLSSYGVMNYPQFAGDYARVGIALYGLLSTEEDTDEWAGKLHPVLSLKARVASVREIYEGEYAGYGMQFEAVGDTPVATVSIGYADGVPRGLSNGRGAALVHGKRVPIIGRICMDQLLLDVSGVPDITAGDEVVLIGTSGREQITAGEVAARCGTITNEILSRMGARITRILV